MRAEETSRISPEAPSVLLRAGALVLPVLKCAVCPACLSVWGSLLAGARLGLLKDERVHGALIVVALVVDFVILGASMRHHARRGPLWLCVVGAVMALLGHFAWEPIEYGGFAVLFATGIWNFVLLRRHHQEGGRCCAHRHEKAPAVPERSTA